VTLQDQPFTEMGADEACPTRHQHPHLLTPS
jgi:hypothetical protein